MSGLNEQIHLFRVRTARDERAFAVLVEKYQKELYRFLRFRVRSEEDAVDGSSEIFFRVWNYLITSHSADHHFRGLLYHTARFWLGDYYRKANRTVSMEELEEHGETIAEKKEGEKTIVARADASIIYDQLKKLKPEHAEIISLKYFQGMDVGDIADRLEKTEGAIRVALHRALKELRTYL